MAVRNIGKGVLNALDRTGEMMNEAFQVGAQAMFLQLNQQQPAFAKASQTRRQKHTPHQ